MDSKIIELRLPPSQAYQPDLLRTIALSQCKLLPQDDWQVRVVRRSIDARQRNVLVNLTLQIYLPNQQPALWKYSIKNLIDVSQKPEVIIIGAGPAGMFAALKLIELGLRPIVLERGKDVRGRRRDLAAINKDHVVNPESNYCFGEGGAGTYSDGKLYTRSGKRGSVVDVLEILAEHGANPDILADAHPHIGTNKLPAVVQAIRQTIIDKGGCVCFDTKVTDLIIEKNKIRGVVLDNGKTIESDNIILATGHSARDMFELLARKAVLIEAKPFALGVRIEHPQLFVDQIQYHSKTERDMYLPAASYSMVTQTDYNLMQRGVFSFCMCPGGFIVPAATADGQIVVNGMSPSRRDSKFANSGVVVAIEPAEWKAFEADYGPLAALEYQSSIEQKAFVVGGFGQRAPAQLLSDFMNRKCSTSVLETSYQPGLNPSDMAQVLPKSIAERLRQGLLAFNKKMPGYVSEQAQMIGVESRTSSPVRIPRDALTLEHPQIKGLFPCGEGGGYAGGIVSAAIDGQRCAQAVFERMRE